MKKLFLILLMAAFVGAAFGQAATIAKVPSMTGSRAKGRVNATITAVNALQDSIEAYDARATSSAVEYTAIVTLDSTDIAGNDAGNIGHVDGAVLVAAPSSAYVLEFVSALFIYDYLTAAYTGGADDIVVQVGAASSQNTVSSAITGASLLEAAGDKVLRVGSIATELVPLVGGALSIAGTEIANDAGAAKGSLRVHITYRKHATGL